MLKVKNCCHKFGNEFLKTKRKKCTWNKNKNQGNLKEKMFIFCSELYNLDFIEMMFRRKRSENRNTILNPAGKVFYFDLKIITIN